MQRNYLIRVVFLFYFYLFIFGILFCLKIPTVQHNKNFSTNWVSFVQNYLFIQPTAGKRGDWETQEWSNQKLNFHSETIHFAFKFCDTIKENGEKSFIFVIIFRAWQWPYPFNFIVHSYRVHRVWNEMLHHGMTLWEHLRCAPVSEHVWHHASSVGWRESCDES